LQRSADAAALAACWELLDDDRLKRAPDMTDDIQAARLRAAEFAAANPVLNDPPAVDQNYANSPDGDVVAGYLHDPNDVNEQLSFANPDEFNSMLVRVRRDSERNGPVELMFAQVLGFASSEIQAEAVATLKDGIVGYHVSEQTGNAELLPFTLHRDPWNDLLDGVGTYTDDYTYDESSGQVVVGPDGIDELNLYPGGGTGQLPPGNFGTVDIGAPDNSASDICRQILYGVNEDDLAYFGGTLELGPDGTLDLNGDTGLSAAVKDELLAIKGMPRAIPIFKEVVSPGENAVFTIVGFSGIRIMNVKLTGPMKKKEVIIQPAFVIDDSAIAGAGSGSSYYVYQPARLVR
jgi:hypothetical protein